MRDIGKEFDEDKTKKLCKSMKQVAIDACETEDEKEDVKELTFEKLEDAYQFVLRHINMGAEIHGVYRQDKYELPKKAVREMIANAVLHRSYLDRSCIQVSIFDDRIEVLSSGMLYGGLDIVTAMEGKSTCRNEAIAEAFHYMHIVEAWGTGIPRVRNKCKEYGLSKPRFEEFGDGFRVTLYRRLDQIVKKKQTNQSNQTNGQISQGGIEQGTKEAILRVISNKSDAKIKEIAEMLNLSESQVKYYIKQLKDEGRLKRQGTRRSGYWIVV